ncbi:MAG: hypothetical protein ACKPB4_01950, partial [Sphaerospermopsis kisseleviana]
AACFALWTVFAIRRMFRELISSRKTSMSPALQWLALYTISFTIGYPFGALKIENFLPQQLFLCGLFAALQAATTKASAEATPRDGPSKFEKAKTEKATDLLKI